jgi:outer membrane protein TolC
MRDAQRGLICLLLTGGLLISLSVIGHAADGSSTGLRLDLQVAQGPAERASAPARGSGGSALSLKECVAMALQNNLDIAVELFNPRVRQQDLQGEEAAFHPSAFLGASRADNRLPGGFAFGSGAAISDNWIFGTGIRQKLMTGGTYEFRFDHEYLNSSTSTRAAWNSRFVLSLQQPLLKNFGLDANETGIRIATNNQGISREQLRLKASDVVTQVHNGYFDLIFALENLEVQQRSLRLARELVTLNRARVRAGVAAPVEVTQAEAQEAARVQDVIVAEKAVRDAEDQLKVILNIPESGSWGQAIQPTDRPPFETKRLNLEEAIRTARESRYEFKSAKLDIENKELTARLTRNQLLPDLAFTGNVSTNALDNNVSRPVGDLFSSNFLGYSVGVLLTVPLGNQGPQATYLKAKLAADQARTSLRQLDLQITQQVREAVRRVEADAKRVDANRAARVLAEEQLRVEQRRLEAGVTTTFNVLSFQRDLAVAQANEIRAIADYNKSLANMEKVQGTVLENNRIEM